MFGKSCRHGRSHRHGRRGYASTHLRATGNSAFDSYKADTLARLEQEQTNFEAFLERLRDAKDKAEFDQFMEERASRLDDDDAEDEPARA